MYMTNQIRTSFFLFFSLILFFSCGTDLNQGQIPYVQINRELNLNTIEYQDLNTQGWIYLNGEGVSGLIIRKQGSNYLVFDRVCTFQPKNSCSKVSVEPSNSRMICPCDDCKSIFDWSGIPNGGAASLPLVQYTSRLINGRTLKITN